MIRNKLILFIICVFADGCNIEKNENQINIILTEYQTGKASYYHDKLHNRKTANGEYYNQDKFTAAHRNLPFGTILLVKNKENDKEVIVRVNDRGPFSKILILDLSKKAAEKLNMIEKGITDVKITILNIDSKK